MARLFLLLFLLLFVPSVASAKYSWLNTEGMSARGTKSGSTVYTSGNGPKMWSMASNATNLGTKAAKAAGTGSKLARAGGVAKTLMKGGKAGAYGMAGTIVVNLGKSLYKDLKDNPDKYPTLSNLLCQTLGFCPKEDEEPIVGTTNDFGNCVMRVKSIDTDGPYCYLPQSVRDRPADCSNPVSVEHILGGSRDCGGSFKFL